MPDPMDDETCMDSGKSPCAGQVELRMSLSATGTPYPRCDRHWADRLNLEDELRQNYPDSACPPQWFDPLAAGEQWNED